MKVIRTMSVLKPVALYLAFACLMIAVIPAHSWAYLVESQNLSSSREVDMNNIQRVLESKMVSQRLAEIGLTRNEINSKLNQLNDADIHQFASQLDSLMPGGDVAITIMSLLVITILVLVIMHMAGYKVIIK